MEASRQEEMKFLDSTSMDNLATLDADEGAKPMKTPSRMDG